MTTTTTQLPVRDLATLNRDCLPIAGGKGANLGELLAAGVPVPGGFVVTTEAYLKAVRDSDVREDIERAIADSAFARVRELIASVHMDAATESAITDAYRRLGGGPVAVRSSGTAEDLADAAFAGQHDTFLNVVGEAALIDAVRDCWASLWTDRAAEYRRDRGIGSTDVAIAVVVQEMVASDAAGVMFTADPVSGIREHVVIDASPGLGEAVVSGLVTPDHYVANKKNGKVLDSALGRREVVIRSVEGGGTVESHEDAATEPVLDTATVRELVALGRRVEAHFGAPQDTEWALRDGRLYLVQARPITAIPEPIGKVRFPQRMLASILAEIITRRPYPLDYSSWTINMFAGVRLFASCMGVTFPDLEKMKVEQDGVITSLRPQAPKPGPLTPVIIVRNLIRGRRFPAATWEADPRLSAFLTEIDRLRAKDLSALSYQELDTALTEALDTIEPMMLLRYDYLPRTTVAALRFRLTLARLGLGDKFGLLLAGAETKTLETNRALAGLAERIRRDDWLRSVFADNDAADIRPILADTETGREFLTAFAAFLDEYGHREITSIALASEPVWRDSPATVLGILKGMTVGDAPEPKQTASERAFAELLAHPKLRDQKRRDRVLRRLDAARYFTSFREDTHFYMTMPQPIVRRILLEYGARLAEAGVLDEAMDVFHLHRGELELSAWPPAVSDVERIRDLVSRRAAIRERLGDAPLIDRRYFASKAADADALLTGMPASAGRFTGVVRIVNGPEDFHTLREGEILVAPFTNPAWTPLFQRAAAVIVDTGGAMSHAAIVAREYGIPAVLGTANAVSTLNDGDRVTVDGDTGSVLAVDGAVTGTDRDLGFS
ncbi:PEP/pyruvate-binding domain-containing protein [Stackebrandtia nassauensis]|uniref:Pyruvate phosphate dikinase PEP/pyruvate-binding protein n=1 Tax=Stackebrandtia nassauensis (strain DSM 44728 / CIP 108903 / NRRL B-16338 / NBRC 102104 / LLR-40K-21) TaxID=446470 RepID=D3QAQ2_STANL|nr:PEP/pyruvate-binding domain-containing protein [Stackebrandtia nassauensis]ADD44698.1 pyruvate phosphate dikinase PEP/pyruvate- binding protein [Stackebrandtia nassauensis DSM 44728]